MGVWEDLEIEHLREAADDAVDDLALVCPIAKPIVVVMRDSGFEMLSLVKTEGRDLLTAICLRDGLCVADVQIVIKRQHHHVDTLFIVAPDCVEEVSGNQVPPFLHMPPCHQHWHTVENGAFCLELAGRSECIGSLALQTPDPSTVNRHDAFVVAAVPYSEPF